MSDLNQWQQANDVYLEKSMEWLRLRLHRAAREAPAPPPSVPERRSWFGRRQSDPAVTPVPRVSERDLRKAADAVTAAEAATETPAALTLANRLGLSPFERQLLLLCAGVELDTSLPELCARASGRAYPTFALAMSLFDNPAWDVLSPERPLRYWRVLEINQPGGQALVTSQLKLDERILNALKGLHYLDDRLGPLLLPLNGRAEALPGSQQKIVDATIATIKRQVRPQAWPVFELVGGDAPSLRTVARGVAAALRVPLYRLPVENIPSQSADLETLARLWQREGLLAPLALYLEAHDLDNRTAAATPLPRFLSRIDGMVFVGTPEVWPDLSESLVVLDVSKPTSREQRAIWARTPGLDDTTLNALSAQFDIGGDAIHRILRTELDVVDGPPLPDRIWEACRQAARPRLESLAQRIDGKARWDRLILPAAELDLLRQLADQVAMRTRVYQDWGFADSTNRGLGISALFAGESGTGKTLAAEVMATELRLDLFRIDLSSVVSKYIGETEKNLRKLFDAAEGGGAILFFDEADALFGKRSEVKDAHDRYANIEINYLLQRMEAYRGLAILATNMKSALDPAFTRRLRFIVNFPFPGVAERRRMWERVLPAATPAEGLDFDRLARLNLTGAGIQNTALNAAFLAATRSTPITMREMLDSARNELRKLERPINESDFKWEPRRVMA